MLTTARSSRAAALDRIRHARAALRDAEQDLCLAIMAANADPHDAGHTDLDQHR